MNGASPPVFCLFVIPEKPNVGFGQEKKTTLPLQNGEVGDPVLGLRKVRASPGLQGDEAAARQLGSWSQCVLVVYSVQE